VVGTHGNALRVRVAARAVDGKANDALVDVLADYFDVPRRTISILRGHTSRAKLVQIAQITQPGEPPAGSER